MTERRQGLRIAKVLNAQWHALSGAASCRVTDISWQGCFVEVVTTPEVNDEASVSVSLGATTLRLRGRVRYVEPHIGFGMRFEALAFDQYGAMRHLLSAQPEQVA